MTQKRPEQICISLSKEGLTAVNWLRSQSVNVSKYISKLVVNEFRQVKEREVKADV